MGGIDHYEWDDEKYETNLAKHDVGFELISALDWSTAAIETDDRFDYGEERGLAYGRIAGRGYAIVFVIRGDRVRIINMRRMHEKEVREHDL